MATATADSIGPYRAIRQLGAGGMGEVFLAYDDHLGRNIALKLLPDHLASDADHLTRLRNEARTASSLNHPNIVTIYDIGRDDGRAFVAMEYVDGHTLRELLRAGQLPVKKALQIAAQIADGLAAAHKRGLVHRDLKPDNIMITSEGLVKILDFGLAKSIELESGDVSEPGTIVGTYAYMSPEQARAGEVDYRSDQFSFGAILYELLTGRRAFDGASGVETLFMVVRDEPPALSVVAPGVPPPVRWIVDRCLSKDAEDRYVSTRDLARDIQYIRDHFSETGVSTPIRERESLATRIRRRWPVAAMIAFALAAGSLMTAWVRKPEPRAITSERYLTYSGHDFAPAVSPDGKLIAFASNRDGVQKIWLKQVSGGSEVALTSGPDDFPRFSPDSSAVIYVRADREQRTASLWRVPVVGGEARRILDHVFTAEYSPDGTKLAFTRNLVQGSTARSTLYVANADGSAPRELLRLDNVGASHPRWSPDQKSIAIVDARGGRVTQTVTIVDAETGAAKVLTVPPKAGEISSVVWSRDGRSVIYVRAESVEAVVGSTAKIVRHDIARDEASVIGWSSHNGAVLDVLADGRLVLDVRSPRDNLRQVSLADGAVDRWITRGNSSDRQPVYSPDGKFVLFSSNRSGNLDLWQTATDGGSVRRITDDLAEDWDPAFTPDGKKIIWSSGRTGNLEIWMANVDGSDARQVSRDGADAENPSATADGWIIYNSFNPTKSGIWKIRPDGSQATRLVTGLTSLPEVSPDGQYVTYIAEGRTARSNLRVVRVADGRDMGFSIPTRIVRRTSAILGRSRWMPDGKAVAYLAQDEDGVNGVFVQDFVPGVDTSATRRPLGGFDRERATESFGISADGKNLMVAGWEQLFSLFSVEGVPHVTARKSEKKES